MKIVLFIVFCMLFTTESHAQSENTSHPSGTILHWRIGVLGGVSANQFVANFKGLPNVPSCCPTYSSGSGNGIMAGIMGSLPITEQFELGLRLGYQDISGTLLATENQTVDNGKMIDGVFEHTITTSMGIFSAEPIVDAHITEAFTLRGGFLVGIPLGGNFKQQERILEPSTIVYTENGQKDRLNYDGKLPDAAGIIAALSVGLSYSFPINKNESLHLVPEASYTLGLTNLMTSRDWRVNGLRFAVGVRYSLIDLPAPLLPTPESFDRDEPAIAMDITPKKTLKFNGAIRRAVYDSTGAIPTKPLEVKNLISSNMYALMSYIFFDSLSSTLPVKYHQLTEKEASVFRPSMLEGKNTLGIYYNFLDILGWRMKVELPTCTIKIIGCNSNIGGELDNKQLSSARAQTIKKYLTDIWGISESRITIQARNLPEVPSNSSKDDGVAENRRVEIIPDNVQVLEPLVFSDTTREMDSRGVRIASDFVSEAGISTWSVELEQSGRVIGGASGKGTLPEAIDCQFSTLSEDLPKGNVPVNVKVSLTDNDRQSISAYAEPIPVVQVFRQKTRIEKFNLIVFGFNVSEISPMNQMIIGLIKNQIKPNSTVSVTGYTDRMGNADYNQRLSMRRAAEIARVLKVSESNATGLGGEKGLYDNDLPEGRFYSRTVRIVVETPIE